MAIWLGAFGLFCAAGLAPGCANPRPPGSPPVVVATIYPLADVAARIGGTRVVVSTLLPPGANPHFFEPTPQQARALARADVLISVGAGLDDWVERLCSVAGRKAVRVVATEGVPLLPLGEVGGRGHHGGPDPHVWLDPILVRESIAPAIAEALSRAAPQHGDEFLENLALYRRELTELDREVREMLSGLSCRSFVAHHAAWGYFARRYGLEEVAVVADAPAKEASARWVSFVVEAAGRAGAKVVFAEQRINRGVAEAIARELGGEVLLLDAMGGRGLGDRESYIGLIRYNARMFARGLA